MERKSKDQAERTIQPYPRKKRTTWKMKVCWILFFGAHLVYFLPIRGFLPVTSAAEPWWGAALVVFDETLLAVVTAGMVNKRTARFGSKDRKKKTAA
jgi:hypothetical protein